MRGPSKAGDLSSDFFKVRSHPAMVRKGIEAERVTMGSRVSSIVSRLDDILPFAQKKRVTPSASTDSIGSMQIQRLHTSYLDACDFLREIFTFVHMPDNQTLIDHLIASGMLIKNPKQMKSYSFSTALIMLLKLDTAQKARLKAEIIDRYKFGRNPFMPSLAPLNITLALNQLKRFVDEIHRENESALCMHNTVATIDDLMQNQDFVEEFKSLATKMKTDVLPQIRTHMRLACRAIPGNPVYVRNKGAYHNTAHALELCIDVLDHEVNATSFKNVLRVLASLMALYHDIVQNLAPPYNEIESGNVFLKDFKRLFIPLLKHYGLTYDRIKDFFSGLKNLSSTILVGGTYLFNAQRSERLILDEFRTILDIANPVDPEVLDIAREFSLYDVHSFMAEAERPSFPLRGVSYTTRLKEFLDEKLPESLFDEFFANFGTQSREIDWARKMSQSLRMNMFELYMKEIRELDVAGNALIPYLDSHILPEVLRIINDIDLTPQTKMDRLIALATHVYKFDINSITHTEGREITLAQRMIECARDDKFHHTRPPDICRGAGALANYSATLNTHHEKIAHYLDADSDTQIRFGVLLLILSAMPEGYFLERETGLFDVGISRLIPQR